MNMNTKTTTVDASESNAVRDAVKAMQKARKLIERLNATRGLTQTMRHLDSAIDYAEEMTRTLES
jgi:tRNA U34 5-carboxymethylaminomethyl modifying GTPase MnmE/TrmE